MPRPVPLERARGRILVMFSGDPQGTPDWVRALETGDDSLDRLADEIQQKAEAAYKQRTAHLPGGQIVAPADPESRPAVASTSREDKR